MFALCVPLVLINIFLISIQAPILLLDLAFVLIAHLTLFLYFMAQHIPQLAFLAPQVFSFLFIIFIFKLLLARYILRQPYQLQEEQMALF